MPRRRTAALLVALLGIALYVVVAPRYAARAVGSGCRTDPIFYFSNGDNLSLTMVMGVVPHEVDRIEYKLHAPANTTLERVVVTGPVERSGPVAKASTNSRVFLPVITRSKAAASPRYVESWTVLNDQPPGTYAAEAVVYTTRDPVPVTFQISLRQYRQSVDGASGKWLKLEVRP